MIKDCCIVFAFLWVGFVCSILSMKGVTLAVLIYDYLNELISCSLLYQGVGSLDGIGMRGEVYTRLSWVCILLGDHRLSRSSISFRFFSSSWFAILRWYLCRMSASSCSCTLFLRYWITRSMSFWCASMISRLSKSIWVLDLNTSWAAAGKAFDKGLILPFNLS